MMTNSIAPNVSCNKWIKRLDTQPYKIINQNYIKVPKVVKPTDNKTLL